MKQSLRTVLQRGTSIEKRQNGCHVNLVQDCGLLSPARLLQAWICIPTKLPISLAQGKSPHPINSLELEVVLFLQFWAQP